MLANPLSPPVLKAKRIPATLPQETACEVSFPTLHGQQYNLEVSRDGGSTWQRNAPGIRLGNGTVQQATFAGNDSLLLFRVRVRDDFDFTPADFLYDTPGNRWTYSTRQRTVESGSVQDLRGTTEVVLQSTNPEAIVFDVRNDFPGHLHDSFSSLVYRYDPTLGFVSDEFAPSLDPLFEEFTLSGELVEIPRNFSSPHSRTVELSFVLDQVEAGVRIVLPVSGFIRSTYSVSTESVTVPAGSFDQTFHHTGTFEMSGTSSVIVNGVRVSFELTLSGEGYEIHALGAGSIKTMLDMEGVITSSAPGFGSESESFSQLFVRELEGYPGG